MPPEHDTHLILARLDQQDAVLDKIDHAINGNGKPGLLSDVTVLKEKVKQIETRSAENRTAIKGTLGTVISGLVVGVLSGGGIVYLIVQSVSAHGK